MSGGLPTTRVYPARLKPALLAVSGVAVGALEVSLYRAPKPDLVTHPEYYQEPFRTAVFVGMLFLGAVLVGTGLYFALTRQPLLVLDAKGRRYRRPFLKLWPLVSRETVRWGDVARLGAVKTSARINLVPIVTLTVSVALLPRAAPAYRGRDVIHLRFDQLLLPMPVDDLVAILRQYRPVDVL